eukprot:4195538-Pleurochrysis_carterae.AAC.1
MSKAEAAWPPPPPFFRKRKHDPPPQVDGNFSMYGVVRSTEEPVNPAPEKQVYDASLPRCQELRRLNKASLSMYMKLLQTMVLAPSDMDSQCKSHTSILLAEIILVRQLDAVLSVMFRLCRSGGAAHASTEPATPRELLSTRSSPLSSRRHHEAAGAHEASAYCCFADGPSKGR